MIPGRGMETSGTIVFSGDPTVGLAMLAGTTVMGGAMGAHMTASIGGEMLLSSVLH